MIDRDDVEQALEIACGSEIGRDITSKRTASDKAVNRARAAVLRFLRELPPDVYIHELLEVLIDEY